MANPTTTVLSTIVALLLCVANASAQYWNVTFKNVGNEDLYLVEAQKTGLVWDDNWKVRGWYKIPAGKSHRVPLVSMSAFGFVNSDDEVEIFRPRRSRTTFPEIVKHVKVHVSDRFSYELKDEDRLGDEYVEMEMSIYFVAVGFGHGDYTITLDPDKNVPGVPLRRSPEEMYRLGLKYYTGDGVKRNNQAAARSFREAANQGYAPAQNMLGRMYDDGKGVERDDVEAIRWYRAAADQGHSTAQYNLGMMYRAGEGIAKSDEDAVRWFRLAAQQGHTQARNALEKMHDGGKGGSDEQTASIRRYLKAANEGDVDAMFNLGVGYDKGEGVPVDQAEAARWYRKAADAGHASAMFNLGVRYAEGEGVKADSPASKQWFVRAMESGHDSAFLKITDDAVQAVRDTDRQLPRLEVGTKGISHLPLRYLKLPRIVSSHELGLRGVGASGRTQSMPWNSQSPLKLVYFGLAGFRNTVPMYVF